MASCKSQAWVTSVINEESVEGALVLAESLHRSKTTRCVVALTLQNVSLAQRRQLREVFDQVLLLDETIFKNNDASSSTWEAHAKAYAFSLTHFEKCVFISSDSVILENADKLFESEFAFQSRVNAVNGSLDLSLFLVNPDYDLWKEMCKSLGDDDRVMTDDRLGTWIMNQGSIIRTGVLSTNMIADFSLDSGKLIGQLTHAPIIRFVDENKGKFSMVERIKLSQKMEMGLAETRITNIWLELYKTVTQRICQSGPDSVNCNVTQNFYKNEPIAIVGMSCRYPGANNLREFWDLLYAGEEGIREPPAFRWTKEHTLGVASQQDRKSQAGFLSTPVHEFDARFFGINPKEAAFMDPQTRLLHEVLWESLEDAGINPLSLYGTHAGIFTGSWMNDYKDIVADSAERDFFRTYMGSSIGAAAARLSFLLGLTGPSIATESGCSSAIVAVDLAVKSLRAGETNLALAGGVNLLLHPFNSSLMEYVISPDGRCKTFDAKANGFGRAEGCGVLVLKRLSDALRDRDNIWAIIRSSAVAQEGVSRSLGTPTVHCESLAMKLALKDANVEPERISFVETHGTGTQVGDPMEVAAIAKAYGSKNRKEPLVIGSIKTNVGHTESCSGITGIMKAVLAMQHEIIPKHRNLETLNPEIFLDCIPAIIPMENLPWPKVSGQPRLCGVSSFGITGTDGHVILEEAPKNDLPKFTLGMERPRHLMTISAKTVEALDELLKEYEERCSGKDAENAPAKELGDMAYTANVGRAAFNHRAFVVASNVTNAAKLLQGKKLLQREVKEGHNPQLCFLFTGQGSQYQGMAKTLYDTSPVFRVHFDHCDRELRRNYGVSIEKALWESEDDSKELSRTIYSQTSIFCVEYCLLRLWQSWGIQPNFVLGHSLGEFCAAVAAGVLEFKDALKLVAERSRLIENLPRGSMLVIKASQPEVEKLMRDAKVDLDIAAVNHPEQTVVAGDTSTIEQFLAYLKSRDVNVKGIILEATHAFHSRHMDPMLEQYRKVAQTITFKRGNSNIQYVSGMGGRLIDDVSEIGADYWVRHTREKVSFIDACAALKECGCQDFLEVGPQPVLSSFVMMNNDGINLNCLPSLRRGQDDWNTILTSLGKLFLHGYSIDWKEYDEPYIRKKVSLPFHPFHRKPFWVESIRDRNDPVMIHPLVGHPVRNASALHLFQNDLTLKSLPYLKDHCIGNRVVFPGAGYTEMCLSAAYCVANGVTDTFDQPTRPMRLENVRFDAPLQLKEGKSCRLQVIVDLPEEEASTGFRVKVFHQNDTAEESGKWVLHASATFVPLANTKECLARWDPSRIQAIMQETTAETPESFYNKMDEQGLKFGESFRSIRRFWTRKQDDCTEERDEVVAEIPLPSDWNKYLLHPVIIDAGFQSDSLTRCHYESPKLQVPVRLGELTLFRGINAEGTNDDDVLYMHVRTQPNGLRHTFLCTADFRPICCLSQVELIDTSVRTIESVLEQQSSAVPDAWEESWRVIGTPFGTSCPKPVDLDKVSLKRYFQHQDNNEKEEYLEIKRLLYLYILHALQQLRWAPEPGDQVSVEGILTQLKIQPKFRPMVSFYLREIEVEGEILDSGWRVKRPLPENDILRAEIDALVKHLKDSLGNNALVYQNLGERLSQILRGEADPLQLLFPQGEEEKTEPHSAASYYLTHPGRTETMTVVQQVARKLFQQLRENNSQTPNCIFRVLEVGAGTGTMSQELLPLLREIWGNNFEFYYTDISQSFFLKAEHKFEEYKDNLKFAVFNAEQSPLSQGIPLEYFDGVCCTDVLHATRDLEESLTHLRQTLKPGGNIVFTETITPARDITYVFGLLEGYWRFEDKQWRPDHCCVNVPVWAELLENTGYEKVFSDTMYMGQFGALVAAAKPDYPMKRGDRKLDKPQDWLVFGDVGDWEEIWRPVAEMLLASGYGVTLVVREEAELPIHVQRVNPEDEAEIKRAIEECPRLHGILYAWGMRDKGEQIQQRIALPFLNVAKAVVNLVDHQPQQLVALGRGVQAVEEDTVLDNPCPATLFGMVKSLKNEMASMVARYVDLDGKATTKEMVAQIIYELAMTRTPKEAQRLRVAYRGGVRYEPRLVKATLPRDPLKLPPCTERYKLRLPETRLIQDLEYIPDEPLVLSPSEVEVKVKAYALNFRDIFTILKPSAEFENLHAVGLDFSGVVTRVGEACKRKWKVGDRVVGVNFRDDQLPSHLPVDTEAGIVLPLPEGMTDWEAACLPAVSATAYYCLVQTAGMRKGDTVLIHTGSGGVGLAAIQLAKHVGATIITTAGNPRKRAYLRSLGIEHVFHSRDTSYEQEILRVTNGRGVDVVLNSITGPGVKEATLRSTARNGRFVEMSKLNTWTVKEVKQLRPDVTYSIVDLTLVDLETRKMLRDTIDTCLQNKTFKPIPYVKFDALYIRQALQYFQKAKHIGKVVVAMPEVKREGGKLTPEVPLFNGESSYLITGGLGGIGFEVCKWMLNLGATDIVLMGRSQPKPDVVEQIKKLNENGANVLIRLGDVGDFPQCEAIIGEITAHMKPLRGVMHCAGVLRDNLYANQTWPDFEATFTPKVQGTWNLHHLTKYCPLEHFVVYSSIAALFGSPGQSNHVAANSFQDAFIHYRHSLGLPGTTLNWGQWAQVGVAKEVQMTGVIPVSFQRMLNGMELALRTQKRQVCFVEFESFSNFSLLIPSLRSYMDERLWKQYSSSSTTAATSANAAQFWQDMDAVETPPEKVAVLSVYLKNILRAALRLEADEPIGDDHNLQELGVDSLMMIELKNSIQTLLGTRLLVTHNLLNNCRTVGLLARAVVDKLVVVTEEEDDGDVVAEEPLPTPQLLEMLRKDAVLDATVCPRSAKPVVKASQIKVVLVTGATGQVGPYLIATLYSAYPSVTKIWCLVRGKDVKEKLQESLAHLAGAVDLSKVEAISGNVTQIDLGLGSEMYEELANSVDAVIHCAAKTHHPTEQLGPANKNQTDIRSVNILGTVNILRFASTGKVKRVYYPSSLLMGVFSETVQGSLSDAWPEVSVIETIVNNGVPALHSTKWICELLLRQAKERGIPCKVFRLPWVGGDSKTGRVMIDPTRNNAYILRYLSFLKVGAVPDTVIPVNVLPVDLLAELTLTLFMSDKVPDQIFNVAHPCPQVEQEFVSMVEQEFGRKLQILSGDQLNEAMRNKIQNNNNGSKELNEKYQGFITWAIAFLAEAVTGYVSSPDTFFRNEKVAKYIPNYGDNFPASMDVVRNDLKYLMKKGLV